MLLVAQKPESAQPPEEAAQQSNDQVLASLPLNLDPVLGLPASAQQARRTLGDNFDERLKLNSSNFTTSIDNRVIFACGFWDNSFRIYDSDSSESIIPTHPPSLYMYIYIYIYHCPVVSLYRSLFHPCQGHFHGCR